MISIFIPGICGIASLVGLTFDYYQRKKFKSEFLVTNRVNGKELIEANVTSTKPIKINNLNKASMYDTFMYAKNFNNFRDEMYHSDVLMYRTDIFTLKKSTYYQYPIVQFRRSPFIEHFPMTNIHTVNYWSRIESLSKTAPEIKINEITDLIITDKTKIFYSK